MSLPQFPADKIKIKIPAGQKLISVVVDNEQGVRVRDIASMQPVEKFGGNPTSGQEQTLMVFWDGKDDDGKPVPAGQYTIRGLSLKGLDALYEYTFYNPGTPPWPGYPNSDWGSNHMDANAIACVTDPDGGDWAAVVGYGTAEGLDHMMALNQDGRKVYGWRAGWGSASWVAADSNTVWAAEAKGLTKYSVKTGRPVGWQRPAGSIAKMNFDSDIYSFAPGKEKAAVILQPNKEKQTPARLLIIDKKSGRTESNVPLDGIYRIAYHPATGELHAAPTNFTGMVTITPDGKKTPRPIPDVAKPGAFKFTPDGTLYVFDEGPDRQIKVISPEGKLLRSIGRKGGAKEGYKYHSDGFHVFRDLDIAPDGRIWTAEGAHPRRIAIWSPDGKLEKELVGNTYYGAWNSTLHNQDPTRGAIWDIMFKINPTQIQDYKVDRFVWSGPKDGSPFNLSKQLNAVWFGRNEFFSSKASGKKHEYMIQNTSGAPVIYIQKNGDYRPSAAIWAKRNNHPESTYWSRPQDPENTLYVWSDLNEDEIIQENEVLVLPVKAINWSGWLFPMNEHFEFYWGEQRIKPTRFTESGIPVYEMPGVSALSFKGINEVIARLEQNPNDPTRPNGFLYRIGDHLFVSLGNNPIWYVGMHVWTDLDGNVVATRRYKGANVHGSMAIPGPLPDGEMLGEMFVSGTAKVNDEVGTVMAIHGNYGQVYFMTEDGIFISHIFKDTRSNPEGWGADVTKGKSWNNTSMLQEAFCGWFGKQDDGKYRYLFGHSSANVVEITGFQDVKRFTAGTVTIP